MPLSPQILCAAAEWLLGLWWYSGGNPRLVSSYSGAFLISSLDAETCATFSVAVLNATSHRCCAVRAPWEPDAGCLAGLFGSLVYPPYATNSPTRQTASHPHEWRANTTRDMRGQPACQARRSATPAVTPPPQAPPQAGDPQGRRNPCEAPRRAASSHAEPMHPMRPGTNPIRSDESREELSLARVVRSSLAMRDEIPSLLPERLGDDSRGVRWGVPATARAKFTASSKVMCGGSGGTSGSASASITAGRPALSARSHASPIWSSRSTRRPSRPSDVAYAA